MPYSITCSNEILTLAMAPFLFIFVGIICEFAMVPCMCVHFIVPSAGRRGSLFFLRAHIYTQSAAHSSKRFKPLFTSCYYVKVVVELEKTQARNSAVL